MEAFQKTSGKTIGLKKVVEKYGKYQDVKQFPILYPKKFKILTVVHCS